MLGKRLINTGGAGACTTDTVQILDPDSTQSTALYRFEDNANDTAYTAGTTVSSYKIIDLDVNGYSSGSTISNSASNTDDATIVGNVTYSNPSGSNGRFDLDGASDYLQINGNVTFNGAANFTVEGWFKPDNLTAVDHFFTIWGANNGPNNKFYVRLNDTDGDIDAYAYTNAGAVAAQVVTNNASVRVQANVFNHIVVTYTDGGSGSIAVYINGALAGSATPSAAVNTTGTEDLYIGTLKGYHGSYDFDGEVGQVRFYTSALSATEVLQNYNATRALYAAYDGTASNITYVTGKFGKALSFSGASSNIETPLDNSNFTSDYSISFWVNLTNANVFQNFTGNYKSAGGYGGFTFMCRSNGGTYRFGFIWWTGSGGNYNFVDNLDVVATSGTWAHLVATKASGALPKLYVNGTANSLYYDNSATNHGTTSENFTIGNTLNTNYSAGLIDQVRVFDKVLRQGEVNSLYNETTTTAALGTIDNPSTVAYYKMADASDETGSYDATTVSNVDFNVQGKYGFAGNFNGSSSQIITGYAPQAGTTATTISLWINFKSYANTYAVIAGDNVSGTTANGFLTLATGAPGNGSSGHLWVSLGDQNSGYDINTSQSFDSYGGIGSWIHVAVTVSGTSVSIYMNGTLATSYTSSVSYAPTASAHNYRFGYINGWGYLDAKLDQVRFFNKAISASEVTKLYNEVQCPNTIDTPESYFNTVLYNNNSAQPQSITTVGFKPDLVWIKDRGNTNSSHVLVDSVRGVSAGYLFSNTNAAQYNTYTDSFTSFDLNGFSLGTDTIGYTNYTGRGPYVAWSWKAASSNTTNNDGTIQSTIRASQESGFSIVSLNKSNTNTDTYGHGLSSAPEMIILKRTASSDDWYVFHKDLGNTVRISLNSDASKVTGTGVWGSTSPTSSVFTLQNQTGGDHIAYCFHSVDGYQRIGSYVGTGTPENFIYTGFEPAWVLIKNTSTGSTNWVIVDNKRDNADEWLYPNTYTGTYDDGNTYTRFYENGFSVANNGSYVNTSGDNYIFLAIAANPDTTAPTKANSFNKLLYTGDDSNNRSITGLGFKPDFLWIKRRVSGSESHALYDSVRGPNLQLSSDTAGAEALNSGSYLGMSSFDDDGFNVGNNGGTNRAPNTYVAWAWKGLDHDRNLASINNDGSIKSLVSVNDAAGFSIVKYKGNETASQTVGHGLSSSPQIAFIKQLDGGRDWVVALFTESSGDFMHLNSTQAESTDTNKWSAVSSTTFTVGNDPYTNSSGSPMIAYCWYSVTGHSSIGKYSGSGSSGKQVTGLGFTPSFVMIKRIDSAGGWRVQDNSRLGTSGTQKNVLEWNDPAAEQSNYVDISFDLNGFTLNTTSGDYNASGTNNYIYMAFK